MKITVYGKHACGKCEAAKEKLKLLGLEFEALILSDYLTLHDGWRKDDSSGVMSAHIMLDTLPIIKIDNEYFGYGAAMKFLKKYRKERA